jgi:uncharacterized FlgJ-related protein
MLKSRTSYILQWLGLSVGMTILAITVYVTIQNRNQQPKQEPVPLIDTLAKNHVEYQSKPKVLHVSSAKAVWDYYEKTGYTMANLRGGHVDVPRIYLASIISNWTTNETVAFKKDLFFRTMLPLILRVNEIIANDREQLFILKDQVLSGGILNAEDESWLKNLAVTYKITPAGKPIPFNDIFFNKLIERVDEIPISMALGQAAYESAYATSRFAMEGNALFGQWRWGSGITPSGQRDHLGDYRIADYNSPLDSTFAFAKNLNSNRAYEKFRILRAQLRAENKPLDGYYLAQGLDRYSERGEHYVITLQEIISHNKLNQLDTVKLGSGTPVKLIPNNPNPK